jgi:hypothetical protein
VWVTNLTIASNSGKDVTQASVKSADARSKSGTEWPDQ